MSESVHMQRWRAVRAAKEAKELRVCECGCGERVRWSGYSRGWSRFVSGHHARKLPFDHTTADGSYLLGAIHGDGYVGQDGVEIAVGRSDPEYASVVQRTMTAVGWDRVKVARNAAGHFFVRMFSRALVRILRSYKYPQWCIPTNVQPGPYLAGLVDTDGGIQKHAPTIWQADVGSLEKVIPVVERLGLSCKLHYYKREAPRKNRVVMTFHGTENVIRFSDVVPLRHPRKLRALEALVERKI